MRTASHPAWSGIRAALLGLALAWWSALAPAQPVRLAYIGSLSGPTASAADARALREGIEAHVAQVNAEGGVHGRTLVLQVFDDRYDGAEFARQLDLSMQHRPLALLSPLGIAPLRALLDGRLLDRHDTVVINAIPGATAFRAPGHPRLFHLRASDRAQIEKVLRHCRTLGLQRVEVLVQDLRAGEQDVREAERRLGAGVAMQVTLREVQPKAEAMRAAAKDVLLAGTRSAALVLGSPGFMSQATGALRAAGVSHRRRRVDLAPQCGISLGDWPRVAAWHARCLARPAAHDWASVRFQIPRPADALGLLRMFL